MTQTNPTKLETSSTIIQRRAIANIKDMITPRETPFLDLIGFDGATKFNIEPVPGNYKIEWIEDNLRTLTGALAGGTYATGTTALTTSTAAYLAAGDVILVDSEKMWISAVSTTGATATRAYDGTTAATHASNAAWEVVGNARTEAAAATYGPTEDYTTNYNYIQTFQKGLKMSRHAADMAQYGISNEWANQVDKATPEMLRMLEISIFRNVTRTARTGSTAPAFMGGFDAFITDNTATSATTALTITALEDMIVSCYLDGGNPDVVALHPSTLKSIIALYHNSQYLKIDRETNEMGMTIEYLDTPWARMRLIQGRNIPATRMLFLQSEYVGIVEAVPFFWKEYNPEGDYLSAEIIGDYSLVVKNDKAHARWVLS